MSVTSETLVNGAVVQRVVTLENEIAGLQARFQELELTVQRLTACEPCSAGNSPLGHMYHILDDGTRPNCGLCPCADCISKRQEG